MTTKISVSLSAVDEGFLKELKSKFGDHTRLDIQVVELDEDPPLTENEFWDIIAQLDWEAPSRDEVLHPAVRALAERPLGHIYQFEDILAEKLFHLDTEPHATAAYPPPQHISEDGFLYIRAAVVASGRETYEAAQQDPFQLPADEDFEPLLSLAALAYEGKTGKKFDYVSPVSYETYSNKKGWEGNKRKNKKDV